MAKILIASDIHGSAFWCDKLLSAFEKEKADKLLLLGDLLYHGPRNPLPDGYSPQKVFDSLNAIKDKIIAVRGNCDSEVDQMVLAFPMMADYAIVENGANALFATHGHLFSADNPPLLKDTDILLNGHFHTPCFQRLEKGFYANCGSVALPKEGYPHTYLVVDGNTLTWTDLETGKEFLQATV